jgi:ubiquitin carboxyl-terminal hydrolase 14
MLQQKLTPVEQSKYSSLIDQYMGGKLAVEMKCDESEDEPVTPSEESFLQLSCFISAETKYMHSGLVSKLSEKITKNSPTLARDAVYTKTSKIDRLPAYLTVQMVRFFYKTQGTNAKVLRDVKFPVSFDAYDLCTKRLQDKLIPMREKFKEFEDGETQKKLSLKEKAAVKKDKNKKAVYPFSFEDGELEQYRLKIVFKKMFYDEETNGKLMFFSFLFIRRWFE